MISGAILARFLSLFKKKMADSRVHKAVVWLVALKKLKLLSQLRSETRSSLAQLLHTAETIRPAASYSGLSKSSTHA